jgi:hypothetical protein
MVNDQAEIKVDYVNAVEVLKKGGQLDLYLAPVTRGTFEVLCTAAWKARSLSSEFAARENLPPRLRGAGGRRFR